MLLPCFQDGAPERGDGGSQEGAVSASNAVAAGGGMSRNELMDIRRRLEMIKNAQSRS